MNKMRCSRCGRMAEASDKFCPECGMFLRDSFLDHRLLQALVYERDGDYKAARLEVERLLEIDPENVLANHLLGTLYFHQGTLDLAVECYEKALAGAPNFLLCWYDLGVVWYHRGNMPRAIAALGRCLEIDPHYNAAHYRLALALFHAGQLDEALEHYEKCSALTPEYLMARYHVGVVHERKGNHAAAAREFERRRHPAPGDRHPGCRGGRSVRARRRRLQSEADTGRAVRDASHVAESRQRRPGLIAGAGRARGAG